MSQSLSPQEAICRLLAGTWDPEFLPASESVPWQEVLQFAKPRNIGGMIYLACQGMHDSMPPDVKQALEKAYYHSVAANTRCLHQLEQLGQAFSQLGTPILLLKGAALTQTLYRDPNARLIGDIDLVVPPDYLPACRKLLNELGYVCNLALNSQEQFVHPDPYHEWVELHWHLLDVPFYIHHLPMDWFWRNTDILSFGGTPFHVLNPNANLVYLPAHLALHHNFEVVHALVDMALLIKNYRTRIDWQQLIDVVRSFELVSAMRATLDRLLECWPDLPIEEPRRLLHAVQPSRTDARLYRLLTAESRDKTLYFYSTLMYLPNFSARVRFIWATLFPPPAYMMRRYAVKSTWQLPYWYLYQLVGGAVRFLVNIPRALRIALGKR